MLDDAALAALVETVAAAAGRVAALVAGELPHDLVEQADESGAELLPSGFELGSTCGCDHWTDPCVHALAVLYQLAWLVDADPFVLFQLRGLPRDELLARLHARTRRRSRTSTPTSTSAVEAALYAARILDEDEVRPGAQLSAPRAIRVSSSRICGVGQQAAVRGGVDQPERRVRHRPRGRQVERGVEQPQLGGPEVDVLPLEGAHLLAGVGRAATPSRGPGRRSAAGAAARSRRASRPARPAPPAGSGVSATRRRPSRSSSSLIETSISASIACFDGKCL